MATREGDCTRITTNEIELFAEDFIISIEPKIDLPRLDRFVERSYGPFVAGAICKSDVDRLCRCPAVFTAAAAAVRLTRGHNPAG